MGQKHTKAQKLDFSQPAAEFPKLRLQSGVTVTVDYEKPAEGACDFCRAPLANKWQMIDACLCIQCLQGLPPGDCEDAQNWWCEHPKQAHPSTKCSKCRAKRKHCTAGFFHPHVSRCNSCAKQGKGQHSDWKVYDASKGGSFPWGAALKAASLGVGAASTAITAAQVHHLLLQANQDGEITADEMGNILGVVTSAVDAVESCCCSTLLLLVL